jgi:adenine deaminase
VLKLSLTLRGESGYQRVVSSNGSYLCSSSGGANFVKEINVHLVVIAPLGRSVILVVDGFYWANWLTGTAINALVRVDVEHSIALVDAINRALINAGLVLHIDTW